MRVRDKGRASAIRCCHSRRCRRRLLLLLLLLLGGGVLAVALGHKVVQYLRE